MNDQGDVNHPSWEKVGKGLRKPHDQSGNADGEHAPEHREIVELLPIGPAIELRLGTLAEKPFLVRNEVAQVLHGGNHRVRAKERLRHSLPLEFAAGGVEQFAAALPNVAEQFQNVQAEIQEGDDRAKVVQGPR